MAKNAKVLNAEKTEYDGIEFDSKLEKNCYCWLKDFGVDFEYNKDVHIVYASSFIPTVDFYQPCNKNSSRIWKARPRYGSMELNKAVVRNHTYKPDFILHVGGKIVYLETKGFATDQWQLRLPLIRKALESNPNKYSIIFAVIKNKKNLIDLLNAINK